MRGGKIMTIEARTYGGAVIQQRRDSNSSNGYQDSPSEDDGYFTSAVSVQHKVSGFVIKLFWVLKLSFDN